MLETAANHPCCDRTGTLPSQVPVQARGRRRELGLRKPAEPALWPWPAIKPAVSFSSGGVSLSLNMTVSISLFLLQSLGNSAWKGPRCPHSGHRASTGKLGVPAWFSPPRCLFTAAEPVGPTSPSGAGCLSPGHQLSLALSGTQQTLTDMPLVWKVTHNKLLPEPKVRKKLIFSK